ncbi:hypothetical protein FACS18949_12310 [Clostridia bacterium]|nr:hypothetical protein FACS18949_12310 [Clostridia bacterium]
MRDYIKGKRCMVWTFMGNTRMHEALNKYGYRLDSVGIFTFEVDATGTISETGTSVASLAQYRAKWPHIKWLLTIMNHGASSVFAALRNDTNGAKSKFLSEILRIIGKYPWCAGVDIDLEKGGDYENRAAANALLSDIYSTVKSYNPAKLVNICLPGMTGVQGSVGGENWCVYADLNACCDTAAIMSYGMAWAGSAPGPVSPRDWLEGIYDYAIAAMPSEKIFMGLPAYGWNWRIHETPTGYRGVSNTYYAAQNWMIGAYNFTNDAPPQPFIPWIAYWDDYNKVPWALPHVYDYMEGWDAETKSAPIVAETYNRRRYLTCYGKTQRVEFGTVYIDESTVKSAYKFNISQSGTYDIAVRICFPFWDKNTITITFDGMEIVLSETRLWWPYWRKSCWLTLAKGALLSAGKHTITVDVSAGAQFFGFCVCAGFSESPSAGDATFSLSPRSFKDVNGNMAVPDRGFKLTAEVLRRKPDSALIWYEDFRDSPTLQSTYWEMLSGNWSVWRSDAASPRPYSQLEGSGKLAWKYDDFSDLHLRARIAFPADGNGRAGVFVGDVFCCINIDTQRVELYQNNTLIGSWQGGFSKTSDSDIRNNPSMYLLEFRKRGNRVRVYSGNSNVLRFTANIAPTSGYCGIQSDAQIKCELLRLGDAWTYEPYEAFDVTMPDGTVSEFGRIPRDNVTWDDEFQVFTLTAEMEESATRTADISMEYDFYHSDLLQILCNADYTAKVVPRDINVWVSRLFLGDADGFSILYYQDVDSLVYWSNEAAYRWGLRGIAIWSLGQEDLRLWEALPKQI